MEILRLRHGEMFVDYGTSTTKVSAGELLILPPKTPHRGRAGDAQLEYDVLMFDVRNFYNNTEICQSLLPAVFDGRAKFKAISSDSETIRCFDALCCEGEKSSLAITAEVYQLLDLFFRNNLLDLTAQAKDATTREIISYMEENFAQELSTASLCREFGYSAAHLCRKFKRATGLAPMTYLQIYRLECASKMLKPGSNISRVAAECGFSDANYFTRCFKAHFGVPPSLYKKE